MRVIFMGSPEFSLPSLRRIAEEFSLVGVVTQPDRPAGRGRELRPPAVKQEARTYAVPILQPPSLQSDIIDDLAKLKPDVIVVAAYGQILPPAVLQLPPHGAVNVHASLLPRWRGASPVQAAILHGDDETGVTIMQMDAGLDTGPILLQESTPIGDQETGGKLGARLAQLGADLLQRALPPYVNGKLSPQPQDDSQATMAPLLRKSDGRLDFRQSAARLERQVRAFDPWPGTFCLWQDRRLAVQAARVEPVEIPHPPGWTAEVDGEPAVHTASNLLVIERLQPSGKREMRGADFLNGAQDFPGSQLPLPATTSAER